MKERTLVTSIRYKPSSLATIVNYMESRGHRVYRAGMGLKLAIDSFENMIIEAQPQYRIFSEERAIEFLASRGIDVAISIENKNQLTNILSLEQAKKSESDLLAETLTAEYNRKQGTKEYIKALNDEEKIDIETMKEAFRRPPTNMGVDVEGEKQVSLNQLKKGEDEC